MPRIRLQETVPFTPQQMYDLVVDMERYPEFLPWCVNGRKFHEEESHFHAEMTVSFKGVREKFQTLDRLEPHKRIHITLLSGPFSNLESEWAFSPAANGCRIDFFIDFQFKSTLLNLTLGPVFSQAAKQMVGSFRNRAVSLYGKHGSG
ncbi:MAG: type II toxin-antitoxin system RatA family toxin [Magnetococcales bacterium]|nr:type II toxin-antitoxin system RatA family toxin [Magnetococcales bacterium]NGZ25623.1 type II toxin-antitoxin system RatA family toxin [Magnetococcales bacterium]